MVAVLNFHEYKPILPCAWAEYADNLVSKKSGRWADDGCRQLVHPSAFFPLIEDPAEQRLCQCLIKPYKRCVEGRGPSPSSSCWLSLPLLRFSPGCFCRPHAMRIQPGLPRHVSPSGRRL